MALVNADVRVCRGTMAAKFFFSLPNKNIYIYIFNQLDSLEVSDLFFREIWPT